MASDIPYLLFDKILCILQYQPHDYCKACQAKHDSLLPHSCLLDFEKRLSAQISGILCHELKKEDVVFLCAEHITQRIMGYINWEGTDSAPSSPFICHINEPEATETGIGEEVNFASGNSPPPAVLPGPTADLTATTYGAEDDDISPPPLVLDPTEETESTALQAENEMVSHNEASSGEHQCPFCPKKCKWCSGLLEHTRAAHRLIRQICNICQRTYTTRSSLTRHMRLKHSVSTTVPSSSTTSPSTPSTTPTSPVASSTSPTSPVVPSSSTKRKIDEQRSPPSKKNTRTITL